MFNYSGVKMRNLNYGWQSLFMLLSLILLAGCFEKTAPVIPEDAYEVIVIGGEPEGVTAAVSAARNGAKTLLIEKRAELGGLFTYGMLNYLDIPQGETGESVSKGIYEEWHQMVGGGNAFGIQEAKEAFLELVNHEPNLTLLTEADVVDVVVQHQRVTEIHVDYLDDVYAIKGEVFIDATQDADFAVMAGAPYFVGNEDLNLDGTKMAVTLMIHLKDVNWDGIRETAEKELFGPATVTDHVAWGFTTLHFDYTPVEEQTRLRGLNLAKVNDEYFINALQIFGVDGLDEQAKQAAIEKGKRETEHILEFLRAEFPGFENAKIASFPSELYVRETRHIISEYQLPMSDLWTNHVPEDYIAYGAYPVDIQATSIHDYGRIIASPKQYGIPFRSLIPKEIDGLLVVGRSSGYSSIAAGSVRVVPTGMAIAEAAGVAAQIAVERNLTFRDMMHDQDIIEDIRAVLDAQGAFVPFIETDYPYQGEWFDEAVQTLMDYGLAFGGYDNHLKVDEVVTKRAFAEVLEGVAIRVDRKIKDQYGEQATELYTTLKESEAGKEPLTRDEMVSYIAEVFNLESDIATWDDLIKLQMISEDVGQRITENREILYQEMYVVGASLIKYIKVKN